MVSASRLIPRDVGLGHFADDDPENHDCRSLIDPSVVKMCKGDLITMACITVWFCFVVWFWFAGYKRFKAFYHARLAHRVPSCASIRKKNASPHVNTARPAFKPYWLLGSRPQTPATGDAEKAPVPAAPPPDPYFVVPRRLSGSLISPTRPPTSPPRAYRLASRYSPHSDSPTHNRRSAASSCLGLGFGEDVPLPAPALQRPSRAPPQLEDVYIRDGLGSMWPLALDLEPQPLAGPCATSTPKKGRRGSGVPALPGSPSKKEGWVMIETV
ncbi:hypothetical protein GLOTRDRAFT_137180 [Gloeophyllum trabeum ATCC 11539]|uniref:Uncharacterized protein n=1 Tax=Gloeophyllum trabeum (strain ATCC 11539 / FP-39264 / Madison 617) TaxID=670483 RepID=S7QGC7_GLOTA|nr:uncharacterized protein GLOTRDRAFT_137180 [Gloeophyllum trabeum ATCC 11539]EPQ58467.1 hypothetical protein GLOTRDRAFT_137180 [Gloeophyllum trabeum ATCC 11539]